MTVINKHKRDNVAVRLPLYKQPKKYYETPVVSYGNVIYLPSTIVKGQLSVAVQGQTRANLVMSSNMNTDADSNGVVDNFATMTIALGLTGAFSLDSAQKYTCTASADLGMMAVYQDIPVVAGGIYSFRVETKVSGNMKTNFTVDWRTSSALIGNAGTSAYSTATSFTEQKLENLTAPANAVIARVYIRFTVVNIGDTGACWAKNSMAEIATSVGSYISTGTKSTLPATVEVPGKNLFDGVLESGRYGVTDGVPNASSGTRSKNKTRVSANTVYRIKVNEDDFSVNLWGIYYDINGQYLGYANFTSVAQTTPSNTAYINISLDNYVNLTAKVQIEPGSTATAYEPYRKSVAYIPVTNRSVPNGTKDEISADGVRTQRVSGDYALVADDIYDMNTGTVNIDIARTRSTIDFPNSSLAGMVKGTANVDGILRIDGKTEIAVGALDNVSSIGSFYAGSDGRIQFVVAKGTSLADCKTAFAGTMLNYQLATPVKTYYPSQPLYCEPSGTIYQFPKVIYQLAEYSGGITIANSNIPIKTMDYCYRLDTATGEYINVLANVVVAGDGLSFTVTGASNGQFYEYGYTYASEKSTVGVVEYKTPLGVTLPITLGTAEEMWQPVVLGGGAVKVGVR